MQNKAKKVRYFEPTADREENKALFYPYFRAYKSLQRSMQHSCTLYSTTLTNTASATCRSSSDSQTFTGGAISLVSNKETTSDLDAF